MKILLTSIGTRGDVQPLLALALELRTIGHTPKFCVPTNFKQWIESFGFEFHPYGPDIEQFIRQAASEKSVPITAEQRREAEKRTASLQLFALMRAARDCDLIIAGGIPQIAVRSIADHFAVPCVFAAYCPVIWPSEDYPPPMMDGYHPQTLSATRNRALWEIEAKNWNDIHLQALNAERGKIGLPLIQDVLRHTFEVPILLAADPLMISQGSKLIEHMQVTQFAEWILPDSSELSDEVRTFLDDGEAPIFFGCGSMIAAEDASRIFTEMARSLGKRAIVSKGWAALQPIDDGADCLFVDDISYQKLFPQVVAVVHHGSAGTMGSAARAGRPQLVIPHVYDQFYLARRVEELGVGVFGPSRDDLTVEALATSLYKCLQSKTAVTAAALAPGLELNGTRMAAEWLTKEFH